MHFRAIACVLAFGISGASAASPFTFGDIEFWVGTGANRAALVVDWRENNDDPPALVWGYRWDGTATGAKMLTDILAADDRLFAKLGGSDANPIAVYGLGYDYDNDGEFSLNDGTVFNAAGVAITQPADLAVASDAADYYAEGWYTGFWHYGVAAANPYDGGTWSDTPVGMVGRQLINGAWDSWTYSPTFDFESFAARPQAAASPYPLGDYDHSGVVEVGDYMYWTLQYGSTSDPAADGNRNGIVDAADYTVWRNQFAGGSGRPATEFVAVPEPAFTFSSVVVLLVLVFRMRKTANLR